MASLYGIVWAICICGIGVMVHNVIPLVASEFAMPVLFIDVWALVFWMVMLWQIHIMCCTMNAIRSLSK